MARFNVVGNLGICFFSVMAACLAAEPLAKPKEPTNYAAVVAQLVSPNKEPQTYNQDRSWVKFPAGYDKAAQQRIDTVRQQLHDNFEVVLPHLIAALDDQRYCLTINWAEGDGYYNKTVGSICKDIIASHLEVFRAKIEVADSFHSSYYNYPITKKWGEDRKGRSLVELQSEAIEWAIERRKAEPKEARQEGRENEVAELQKLGAELKQSGKPLPPRRMLRMITNDAD